MFNGSSPHAVFSGSVHNRAVIRKVAGETGSSTKYAGFDDFVARANSRTFPDSTTSSNGFPVCPTTTITEPPSSSPDSTSLVTEASSLPTSVPHPLFSLPGPAVAAGHTSGLTIPFG